MVVQAGDSRESTVATCNSLHSNTAGSTLKGLKNIQGERRSFMHIALGVAFGMIAAAPFIGRWRANVWLKKNMSQEQSVNSIPEIA